MDKINLLHITGTEIQSLLKSCFKGYKHSEILWIFQETSLI